MKKKQKPILRSTDNGATEGKQKTKKGTLSKTKLLTLKTELERLENTILSIKQTINEIVIPEMQKEAPEEQVIEGIFDGEFMVANKKKYPVPPNYASKSKLVEGDKLKLKIEADGSFVYKQIEPIERKNLIGTLEEDEKGFKVRVKNKTYRVLLASITYYGAKTGDKIAIIVPENEKSIWASVEGLV